MFRSRYGIKVLAGLSRRGSFSRRACHANGKIVCGRRLLEEIHQAQLHGFGGGGQCRLVGHFFAFEFQ